jgi:hypothetical protein
MGLDTRSLTDADDDRSTRGRQGAESYAMSSCDIVTYLLHVSYPAIAPAFGVSEQRAVNDGEIGGSLVLCAGPP